MGIMTFVLYNGTGTLTYTDEYSENADTGITLSVVQSGNEIFVKYTSTNTGLVGSMTYSVSHVS
jgi:hypothetical protein